ncbi:dihydropteroate synthase [Blastococcus sp. SYSU DS0973]
MSTGPLPRTGRCLVMGVLNVTPDSFSDGGCFADPATAIAHGLAMHVAGADYVDVGGESTRPGADRVDATEECRRVLPVIRELSAAGVRTSVDTTRAEVAEAALDAGAVLVNDVSGGLADEGMAKLVADAGAPWVLMHWRGHSREMYAAAQYGDVVTEVCAELTARVEDVVAAGVHPGQLVLDPGLGFAKRAEHNWALLAGLDRLVALGLPVLVGASRKTFLGKLLAGPGAGARPAEQRDAATLATTVLAAQAGAWGVRVHDAAASVDAVRTLEAVRSVKGAGRG